MAKNFVPALSVLAVLALAPAAASFAQQENSSDSVREISQFMSVFERVKAEYVDQVTDEQLIRGAIDGMLNSLDPHSSYLDARGFRAMMTTTDGNYGGLGLTVTMEDSAVKVIAATRGTPADQAGIKAGDFITHIDGHLFYGGTLDEAVDRMRGNPGTSVRLTIVRPGRERPFDVTVTRAIIDIPAVRSEVRDNVGIISVNTFSRVTTDGVARAITDIERQLGHAPAGYVLDLRSNPGGLLDQAVGLSDLFLERGEIVSQRGRRRTDIERYYARPGDATHGAPIIVLVDAGTASASEIVAGALQDHRRAIVMGERSFGKGSVQTLLPLGDGSTALRLTTARYYTPSGRSVQEGGIAPDVVVPQLTDPDYRSRNRIRESDLRRHLVNEAGVRDDLIQDDGRPDPRFQLTAAQLQERHITDFQLDYAVRTLARLSPAAAPARVAGATPRPRAR
ncbi:S41 family peptidase [Allosphingosinicella sp.]|uniref:S41 family peptidase n=1 Tax=Allosphingosinicella sp. TaxID=2823234 RepID=UPI0037830FFB